MYKKKYIPPHMRKMKKESNNKYNKFNIDFTHLIKNKKRKCCGGIIVFKEDNELNILIVKGRSSSKWGLPKGGIEMGESQQTCAIREIKEESGLLIHLEEGHKKLRIHSTYYFIIVANNMNNYLHPMDKNEISDIKWINIKDIKHYHTNRELRDLPLKIDNLKNLVDYYHKKSDNIIGDFKTHREEFENLHIPINPYYKNKIEL